MKTIGLCMIVKNEAHVITRCLDSVRPLVDYALVEDTGSTDGTQGVVREWMSRNNMPGLVIEEPWQGVAYNRTHVMEALRKVERVDYALIIDADDRLVLDSCFDPMAFKEGMRRDLYDVQIRDDDLRYLRPQLCNNRLPFRFKAVLHEYLEAPKTELMHAIAEGFHIESGRCGARNKNPRKYQDDAAALEKALLTETESFLISRYTFCLAQSYRDCGEREKALMNYLKRAQQGFWTEEIFFSLYQAGKLKESLRHPSEEVLATYQRASDVCPSHAEALHAAARYCRLLGRYEEAYQYAKRGAAVPNPVAGMFTESWIYDCGLLDELARNALHIGRYQEYLEASERCKEILATYLNTSDASPSRAEALLTAARYCRLLGRYEEAYQYAKRGAAVPMQGDGLLRELARNALHIGQYQECLEACERLLREGRVSPDVRKIADYAAGAIAGFYIMPDREPPWCHDPDKYRKDSKVLEKALRMEDDPFLRARYNFYLSLTYQKGGEREKALATGEEAVRLHRALAGGSGDAFLPELAPALNNLSELLSDSHRHDEALAAGEEAVRLYREVAGRNAGAFLPEVASALNNLSKRLSDFDRHEEALAASEEAVRLYREVAPSS
jgi:tetratricopeptide (TPR) repeat protein